MTLGLVAVEIGVVDPAGQVVDVVEHDRATLVLEQTRIGRGDLHHRAVRAEVAAQDDERAALGRAGSSAVRITSVFDDLGTGDVLAHRAAA